MTDETAFRLDSLGQPVRIGDWIAIFDSYISIEFGVVCSFTPKGCRVRKKNRDSASKKIYYSDKILRLSDEQSKALLVKVLKS